MKKNGAFVNLFLRIRGAKVPEKPEAPEENWKGIVMFQ